MQEIVENRTGDNDRWNRDDDPQKQHVTQSSTKNVGNSRWCRVWRQEGVADVQSSCHRYPQVHQRHVQLSSNDENDWQNDNQTNFKEQCQTNDKRCQNYGNLNPAPTKLIDQSRGNPVATTSIRNQLTQHGPKSENNC